MVTQLDNGTSLTLEKLSRGAIIGAHKMLI